MWYDFYQNSILQLKPRAIHSCFPLRYQPGGPLLCVPFLIPSHDFSLWILSSWLLSTFQSPFRTQASWPPAETTACGFPHPWPRDSGLLKGPALLALTRKGAGGGGLGGDITVEGYKSFESSRIEIEDTKPDCRLCSWGPLALTPTDVWPQTPTASRPSTGEGLWWARSRGSGEQAALLRQVSARSFSFLSHFWIFACVLD